MIVKTAYRCCARNLLRCAIVINACLLGACSDNSDKGLIERSAQGSSTSGSSSSTSGASSSSGSVSSSSGTTEPAPGQDDTSISFTLSSTQLSAQEDIDIVIEFRDEDDALIAPTGDWQVSSTCSRNFNATISELQFNPQSINLSYTPVTCVGEDTIDFSVTIDGDTTVFQRTLTVAADTVNQILFVSNEPALIALKGSGLNTQADVTFQVKGVSFADGIPDQLVEFELEGDTGGISLVEASARTDESGMVTARVQAGTVPGIVVVKAVHTETGVTASSEYITVSTGYTYPAKFQIAASVFNPNARNKINGENTDITVALSDRVGNAVADGTRVRFFAEAGRIPEMCETSGGSCTVTWKSSADEPANGRVQIFAVTKGIEDFIDNNNNFILDDGDSFPEEYDLSEPFMDSNTDGVFNQGPEYLYDTDKDGAWSESDGLWNGPNCQHSALCSNTKFADLGKQLTIFTADDSNPVVCALGTFPSPLDGLSIAPGGVTSLQGLYLSDGNSAAENELAPCPLGNPLPNGTTLSFAVIEGELSGVTSWKVPRTSTAVYGGLSLTYKAPSAPQTDILTLTITIPSSEISHYIQWPVVIE